MSIITWNYNFHNHKPYKDGIKLWKITPTFGCEQKVVTAQCFLCNEQGTHPSSDTETTVFWEWFATKSRKFVWSAVNAPRLGSSKMISGRTSCFTPLLISCRSSRYIVPWITQNKYLQAITKQVMTAFFLLLFSRVYISSVTTRSDFFFCLNSKIVTVCWKSYEIWDLMVVTRFSFGIWYHVV